MHAPPAFAQTDLAALHALAQAYPNAAWEASDLVKRGDADQDSARKLRHRFRP